MPTVPEQERSAEMHISLFYDDRVIDGSTASRNFKHPAAASKEYDRTRVTYHFECGTLPRLDEKTGRLHRDVELPLLPVLPRKTDALTPGPTPTSWLGMATVSGFRSKRVDIINCDAALNTIIIYNLSSGHRPRIV